MVAACLAKHSSKTLPDIHASLAPGFVEDLVAEYRRASVVPVPVESGGGLRIQAIEARVGGRPVLATSKGAEGVDHGGMALLDVAPLRDCSGLIVRTLVADPCSTDHNWAQKRRELGAQRHSAELAALICGVAHAVREG
jgi:hypothetical protein